MQKIEKTTTSITPINVFIESSLESFLTIVFKGIIAYISEAVSIIEIC
jgi:hypothetical protein